jgi:hypothetical protein
VVSYLLLSFKVKNIIQEINALVIKATAITAKGKGIKDLTEDDVDELGGSIDLLNDLYEVLYNQVFDNSGIERE